MRHILSLSADELRRVCLCGPLGHRDVVALSLTCRGMHAAIAGSPWLWAQLFQAALPNTPPRALGEGAWAAFVQLHASHLRPSAQVSGRRPPAITPHPRRHCCPSTSPSVPYACRCSAGACRGPSLAFQAD